MMTTEAGGTGLKSWLLGRLRQKDCKAKAGLSCRVLPGQLSETLYQDLK